MIILSEVSPKEKDKYDMMSLICGIKKKKRYNGLTYKNRNIPTDLENKPMAMKGEEVN